MKRSILLLLASWVIIASAHSDAMWLAVPDATLVKNSSLIVEATYIGTTHITINKTKSSLGVLNIDTILKGNIQEIVLIYVSTHKNSAQRGDDINFKVGQQGLWLLTEPDKNGIYKINMPQEFISKEQLKTKLPKLLEIIRQQQH